MQYPTAEGIAECIAERRYKEAVSTARGLITIAEIEMGNAEAFIKWRGILSQWIRKRIHPPFSKYVVRVIDEVGTREKQPHGRPLKPNELNQNAEYYSCLYTLFGLVGDIDGQLQAWFNMNLNAAEVNPQDWCELAEELEKNKRYSNAAMCMRRAIDILEHSLQHRFAHVERLPLLHGLHSCWNNRRRLLQRAKDADGQTEAQGAIEDVEDRIREEQQQQQSSQMQHQHLHPMMSSGGYHGASVIGGSGVHAQLGGNIHLNHMMHQTPHAVQY